MVGHHPRHPARPPTPGGAAQSRADLEGRLAGAGVPLRVPQEGHVSPARLVALGLEAAAFSLPEPRAHDSGARPWLSGHTGRASLGPARASPAHSLA